MFAEFISVSGYLFWVIVAAILLLDILFLSTGDAVAPEAAPVFITVVALILAVLFTDAFAGVRVLTLVAGSLVYLIAGVIWAFKKWYSFLVEKRADLRKQFGDAKPDGWGAYAEKNRPTAAQHKQRITNWMTLWPFSFSWWVLTWPRHAFVWLYERLSTVFDRLSAKVFAS